MRKETSKTDQGYSTESRLDDEEEEEDADADDYSDDSSELEKNNDRRKSSISAVAGGGGADQQVGKQNITKTQLTTKRGSAKTTGQELEERLEKDRVNNMLYDPKNAEVVLANQDSDEELREPVNLKKLIT